MQWISAVLTAALAAAGYYGMLCMGQECGRLELKSKGIWMTDRDVALAGAVNLIGSGTLAVIRFPYFPVPQYILTVALVCSMAAIAVIDFRKKLIPNRMLAALGLLWIAVAGLYLILDTEQGIVLLGKSLTGALAGGLIFLVCHLVSRGQMGAGDVKLAFVMGLYLTGERVIGGILYGTLLCCIYSISQLLRKRLTVKDGVPMTPFLYLGVLITLFII